MDFKDSYPTLESDSALIPILGQRVGDCFEQSFTFKVEGDKLPKDQAADIVSELQELFARHNATDALTVKEGIKPVAGFHLRRHTMFSAEVNLQLNGVCPIRAAVATKNVK
ncbi:MAG: hypothetical protein A2Y38_01360 [Spirochaetes bacterium GWB1_59_5]|nr:MAG: hypothetical protein A2Y38_01360 [Spirochaetes bacterium GWB1_59_5]